MIGAVRLSARALGASAAQLSRQTAVAAAMPRAHYSANNTELPSISHLEFDGPRFTAQIPEFFEARAAAFAARIGVDFSDKKTLHQALIHPSFSPGRGNYNDRLSYLGYSLLHAIVTEHIYVTYPNLPTHAISNLVDTHLSNESLYHLGKSLGLDQLLLWKPANDTYALIIDEHQRLSANGSDFVAPAEPEPVSKDRRRGDANVIGRSFHAIAGAIYHEQGHQGVRNFANKFILSRVTDIGAGISIRNPRLVLEAFCKKYELETPTYQIIRESGRASHRSMFMVGAFSGKRLLGIGNARSIDVAQIVAAKNALRAHFLEQVQNPLQLELGPDASIEEWAPARTPASDSLPIS
ncbi:hypothetical protein H696_03605 [Fonticula alba]|uniref:Large ribosomal subunit protein mL44 n=1 Tax=Fonticula alba TaxID=691883 RepID=A0A058Z7Q8_FONAL|nr:hypothetical protein H696_03605 [Fonticula alba]KCV70146.1 hypothetical protein H696_03605 [Fonticula alba]|eukprot:XP_009495752.1 hypothetical protein H696_03605 [Fonticula alba]